MLAEEIHNNVLDLVGNTPCVRLDRLARAHGLQCELVAKLEFFNPGGSIKDRIAKNMVLEAEKTGLLKPGDTLVEPTSGNTGIGLAMVAAVRGYNCILTMPQKMSSEKVFTLQALGSEVVRTPDSAKWDSPESHFGVAKKLTEDNPLTHHVLDQYSNPANPAAHVKTTAEEIYRQTGGKLDMIVMSVGTGGTMSGTSRRLKELIPGLKVVAVDPDGSRLHDDNATVHSYHVEGIGQLSILPKVLDRGIVDEWVIVQDDDSFRLARQMIRLEGVLCGGSSGTAMAGAIRAAQSLGPDQRCLVILPDSIRNYFTRFLDDNWMVENGFEVPNMPASPAPPTSPSIKPGSVPALCRPAAQAALLGCVMFALGLALGRRR